MAKKALTINDRIIKRTCKDGETFVPERKQKSAVVPPRCKDSKHKYTSVTNDMVKHFSTIVRQALADEYHYDPSPQKSFGYLADEATTRSMLKLLVDGEMDIEILASAAHDGWSEAVVTIDDPIKYANDPTKKAKRLKLAKTPFVKLPVEEQDKDRVAAKALLVAWNAEM